MTGKDQAHFTIVSRGFAGKQGGSAAEGLSYCGKIRIDQSAIPD